jgi:hypothetical protein
VNILGNSKHLNFLAVLYLKVNKFYFLVSSNLCYMFAFLSCILLVSATDMSLRYDKIESRYHMRCCPSLRIIQFLFIYLYLRIVSWALIWYTRPHVHHQSNLVYPIAIGECKVEKWSISIHLFPSVRFLFTWFRSLLPPQVMPGSAMFHLCRFKISWSPSSPALLPYEKNEPQNI